MYDSPHETWTNIGRQLRIDSIRASSAADSGHPTSSMSAADLMAVLLERYLRYDFDSPEDDRNDHLVFSKGHASPLLYAMYRAAGAIDDEALLSYRRRGSRFEGHPTPVLPWVDVATGSLGQGLPIGVGMALAGKHLEQLDNRIWVVCGDSEMAEGSMWEAFEHAAHFELDDLTAIVDVNRLGQRGETMVGWNLDAVANHVPLPSDVCQKSADGVLKQCQAAVKAASKCWTNQYGSVPKTAKPACKTEGSAASECNAYFKDRYASASDELDAYVSFELDCCEDRVADYYGTCVTGVF